MSKGTWVAIILGALVVFGVVVYVTNFDPFVSLFATVAALFGGRRVAEKVEAASRKRIDETEARVTILRAEADAAGDASSKAIEAADHHADEAATIREERERVVDEFQRRDPEKREQYAQEFNSEHGLRDPLRSVADLPGRPDRDDTGTGDSKG